MFLKKKKSITVQDNIISINKINDQDYISLTDMVRKEEGDDHIRNWLRNRNTVEFIGLWETINNPDFKPVEFDRFRKEAGLNSFHLTPKKWVDATNAKGIISKSGRYGGTYAHKDIAFEFGSWISPTFKLYLIREYQRLKEIENNEYNLEWNVKRILSKTNYQIHTDAVKEHIIPSSRKWKKEWEYSEEADLVSRAVFGCTAKQWQEENPDRHKSGENMRDSSSINELVVLSNAQSMNAELIHKGLDKKARFQMVQDMAGRQLYALDKIDSIKSIKKASEKVYLMENKGEKF